MGRFRISCSFGQAVRFGFPNPEVVALQPTFLEKTVTELLTRQIG